MTEAAPAMPDDIESIPNPPNRRAGWLRWLWLLLPWSWFVVQGLHPWFELVAILLPVIIVVAAACAILAAAFLRSSLWLAMTAMLVAFFLVAVVLPGRPIGSPTPTEITRFASINVAQRWFSNNDVAFYLETQAPQVFIGVEFHESHDAELRKHYTNAISDIEGVNPDPLPIGDVPDFGSTYRRNDFPSIGIYSNFDLVRLEDPIAEVIDGGLPGFRAQVATPYGDWIVYALHVPRPGTGSGFYEVGPSAQAEMLDAIGEAIEAEDLPVVVVGDLNIVDRGPAFNEFAGDFTDALRVDRWAGPTRTHDLWFSLLRLRIDHLLVGSDLCVSNADARDVLFTDHTPIRADIGPCPAA